MISSEKASNNLSMAIAHFTVFFTFLPYYSTLLTCYNWNNLTVHAVEYNPDTGTGKKLYHINIQTFLPTLFLFWGEHCISMSNNKNRQLWNTVLNVVVYVQGD